MKHALLAAGGAFILAGLLSAGGCNNDGKKSEFGWWGPTEELLVKLANDPTDPDRRRQGIGGLAKLNWGGAARYAGLFVERLGDEATSVRSAAVRALGKVAQPKYLPQIIGMLEDRAPTVRDDAADMLDAMPGEGATSPLQMHAASDANLRVRERCARALRHYPTKDVMNTLVGCLKDDQPGVRFEAHKSLVAIAKVDYGDDVARWGDYVAGRPVAASAKPYVRPSWDWLGITEPPRPRPVEAPAAPGVYKRPAWDWLGVTEPPKPKSPPAPPPVTPNP